MTTMVCRFGSRHRVLIRTRVKLGRALYAGCLIENNGRPAHVVLDQQGHTSPIRLTTRDARGLTELLVALDDDAELYASTGSISCSCRSATHGCEPTWSRP